MIEIDVECPCCKHVFKIGGGRFWAAVGKMSKGKKKAYTPEEIEKRRLRLAQAREKRWEKRPLEWDRRRTVVALHAENRKLREEERRQNALAVAGPVRAISEQQPPKRHYEHHRVRRPDGVWVEKYKVGRNEPCPCGSGHKFKKCHGA